MLSEAKDLLRAYAVVHAAGAPLLRLHRGEPLTDALRRVTNALLKRVIEHREETYDGFTKKYKCHRLVYFEHFQYIVNAIEREKVLKGWLRAKKIALINDSNPTWEDLSLDMRPI